MRIIPSTINGPILVRAIGSTDFRGAGTPHPIADANPFVFLEHLSSPIQKPNVPPFGLHPHSGVTILTIGLSGVIENVVVDPRSSDKAGNETQNQNGHGKEKRSIHGTGHGPFLVATNAGRGVVHDEHTYTSNPCDLVQCAFVTGDNTSEAHISYVEEPTILHQKRGDESSTSSVSPSCDIMICAGSFRGKDSGLEIGPKIQTGGDRSTNVPTLLHITIPPGGCFEMNDEDMVGLQGGNTFVYNMTKRRQTNTDNDTDLDDTNANNNACEGEGSLVVNNEIQIKPWNLLSITSEDDLQHLKIENRDATEHTSAFVGYGKPIVPSWTKLLMFNGFIFAPSEADAERKEEEYKQLGMSGFGK